MARTPQPRIPTIACIKFRMPYAAIDVYTDPATGKTYNGDTLTDAEREKLQRSKNLSQTRYDKWLEQFRTNLQDAMPSFTICDERPSNSERVILRNKLFHVEIIARAWYFTVRLATNPDNSCIGLKAIQFPKFCRAARNALLQCEAADAIIVKQSQTSFLPLKDLSDEALDAMSSAVRIRINKNSNPIKGYNEPAKPDKRKTGSRKQKEKTTP